MLIPFFTGNSGPSTLSQSMLEPIDRLMDSESAIDGVRKEKERLTAACLFFIAAAVSFPTMS
jgi:hypothetical protein